MANKKKRAPRGQGIPKVEFSRPADREREVPAASRRPAPTNWYGRLSLPWKRMLWAIVTFVIVVPVYIAGMEWRGEPWDWNQALGVGAVLSIVFLFFAMTREYTK